MQDLITNKKTPQVHAFGKSDVVKMSAFQPIEITPTLGRDWITNGIDNINFKVYRDAYDDSPTNQSIINAFVNYIYGEGLYNKSTVSDIDITTIISKKDVLLICQDYKVYGGYAVQVIWDSNLSDRKPLKLEYIPIYKLGVNYELIEMEINGYWYSWDWTKRYRYRPELHPKFTGKYVGNDLEIMVVKRPHAEPFFPIPDYISGIPWARVEGELANAGFKHFKNSMSDITVINYNSGRQETPELARQEAEKVRGKVCGTDNESAVLVAFNESAEEAIVVDRISPPELNNQNVFYSEEAERKLIVAHSAPPILFAGSNTGSGFSSNADEIDTATNALYRRHINPMREVILDGLESVLKLIDSTVRLDFKDFKEEKLEGAEKVVEKVTVEEPVIEQKKTLIQKLFK
jgi:hypothetical protein